MGEVLMSRRLLGVVVLLAACGSKSNDAPPTPPAEGACLDRPGALPRPPARGLPCELLPPGKQR